MKKTKGIKENKEKKSVIKYRMPNTGTLCPASLKG
jgi:hypothetical protein